MGDVSKKAISCLEREFPNVRVCETTMQSFVAQPENLLIINVAEYFLTQEQLSDFVGKGGEVILNNVHLYIPGGWWRVSSIINEVKFLVTNVLALVCSARQMQFRGWMRTVADFLMVAENSEKYVKAIIFNKQSMRNTKIGQIYSAMIHCKRQK